MEVFGGVHRHLVDAAIEPDRTGLRRGDACTLDDSLAAGHRMVGDRQPGAPDGTDGAPFRQRGSRESEGICQCQPLRRQRNGVDKCGLGLRSEPDADVPERRRTRGRRRHGHRPGQSGRHKQVPAVIARLGRSSSRAGGCRAACSRFRLRRGPRRTTHARGPAEATKSSKCLAESGLRPPGRAYGRSADRRDRRRGHADGLSAGRPPGDPPVIGASAVRSGGRCKHGRNRPGAEIAW